METPRIDTYISLLKMGRKHTLTIVDGVPKTHYYKQLAEEKATPIWLLGHLAGSVDRILLQWTLQQPSIVGEEMGKRFAPAHAGGLLPTTNPDDYPPWDGLKLLYVDVMRAAIKGARELTEEDLAKPLPGDVPPDYRERFPTIDAALRLLIAHDAYHRGQIGMLAKLD